MPVHKIENWNLDYGITIKIFAYLKTFRNITAVADAIVFYNKFKNREQVHNS